MKEEFKQRDIVHVTQPHERGCVGACLAMISGKTFDDIAEQFEHICDVGAVKHEIIAALDKLNIDFIDYHTPRTATGRIFLAGVMSLNVTGGFHCVVLDQRYDMPNRIYDPNEGVVGKKVYSDMSMIYSSVIDVLEVFV